MRGRYVVLEGGDRVGKSTQTEILVEHLKRIGISAKYIREPGGTREGEVLRRLALDQRMQAPDEQTGEMRELTQTEKAALHNAARIVMLATVVKELLGMGVWVVSDRSYLSTIVYQGYAEGGDMAELIDITNHARQVVEPDLILVLDGVPERMRMRRDDSDSNDRYDNQPLVFHDRLREGYLREAKDHLFPVVNADDDIDEVTFQIWQELCRRFEEVK